MKLYPHLDCRTILAGDFNMVEGWLVEWGVLRPVGI